MYDKLVQLGADFVLRTQYIVALWRRARNQSSAGDPTAMQRFLKEYKERPDPKRLALESGRYTEFIELTEDAVPKPRPRAMRWRKVTEISQLPKPGSPRFFIAPDLDKRLPPRRS